jgi:hypothetical protein
MRFKIRIPAGESNCPLRKAGIHRAKHSIGLSFVSDCGSALIDPDRRRDQPTNRL